MKAARWWPVLGWVCVIEVLTSVPTLPTVAAPSHTDKFVHFAMYALLGWLVHRAVSSPAATTVARSTQLWILAALAVFAALDEGHQYFIPERSMELGDWLADVCGATCGVLAHGMRVTRRVSKRGAIS